MKPVPLSVVSSPGVTSPPMSLTSKEWIVPPRPKPGRKPATDTPPTKRKAQNRAAQRAFRERRAARVGELEEQLKEIEDQNDQEQDGLRATITELEQTLERCQADLASWVEKCHKLEKQLKEAQNQTAKHDSAQSHVTANPEKDVVRTPDIVGCGNCTLESHCQCIEDVVQGMNNDGDTPNHAQKSYEPANKRIKLESAETNAMEIDFTAVFSKTAPSIQRSHTSAGVADPCGFCQDGTPCICAEMAAEQERMDLTRPSSPATNNRPMPRQIAQFTPPPSEGDVATSSSVSGAPARCASGPGTCAQCVSDPNSTVFCKSLAASRAASAAASGCCGGKNASGGCCQTSVALPPRNTRSRAAGDTSVRLPAPIIRNPITLTCADAFTALSRHRAYEEASGDMASWMPKLYANPTNAEDRPAMEIDAANVMAVLKDFDRRFGANK